MAETSQQRVRRVFIEVADLSGEARLAALDRACAGDAVIRTEVEALLRAEEQAGGFMSSPTAERAGRAQADSAERFASPLREGPGTRIGPYQLLQLIGEGGFGTVFMAEQEKPVVRKVALKIIKLGMDTRAGDRAVRGRAAGAGDDGSPQHRAGAGCGRD